MKVFLVELPKNSSWTVSLDNRNFWAGGKMHAKMPKLYDTEKGANRAIDCTSSYMDEGAKVVVAELTIK